MDHRIVLEFKPFPQARPRLHKSGFAYDPSKKKKQTLSLVIKNTWKESPLNCPIEIFFRFNMQIPKTLSKKKKIQLVGEKHTKKADLDNLIKSTLDAMNGIMIKDDALVWKISAEKVYATEPSIEILIRES